MVVWLLKNTTSQILKIKEIKKFNDYAKIITTNEDKVRIAYRLLQISCTEYCETIRKDGLGLGYKFAQF